MVFLSKLFGSKDPLASLRRATKQHRWADVLHAAEVVRRDHLSPEMLDELHGAVVLAGNQLAEINLYEGDACLRAGELDRALEHFQLAAGHARSEALKSLVGERLAEMEHNGDAEGLSGQSATKSCCSSGCHPSPEPDLNASGEMDMELRLELSMTSYPPELAARYATTNSAFKQALLLSFDGHDAEALTAFDGVREEDRDDLYQFERGALLVRMGEGAQGRSCLLRAVALNPDHHLAMETLVNLDLMEQRLEKAEEQLRQMLSAGISTTFCYSRLAQIHAGKSDSAAAIEYGEQALASGPVEINIVVLLSSCLEKVGRVAEAETVLLSLPAGGCGGGVHYLLAEFWLRHGKSLPQALESFKSQSRQDPSDLRWPLRIAQTYFGLGWKKDGQVLMEKILATPGLQADLRQEAEQILAFYGK